MYIKLKRNIVMLKVNRYIYDLLFVLWDIGLISGFNYITELDYDVHFLKNIKVFLNYKSSGKPIFDKVVFFSKGRSKCVFNFDLFLKKNVNLSILNIKSFVLVWTNFGLMLLKTAIKKKLGGFLFCKFI